VLYTQTDLVASDVHNMDNGYDVPMGDVMQEGHVNNMYPPPPPSYENPYKGEIVEEQAEPAHQTPPRSWSPRAPHLTVEVDEQATRAHGAYMRKQQLARVRREAGYRARAQTSQSPREPRTQVPSASRNERREDDPRGGAESALYKARALAAKARREAKQALATKAKADQAELNLRIKEREVEAHNARRKRAQGAQGAPR
jgi:hypothetical protein